jgi:hypothetical protein
MIYIIRMETENITEKEKKILDEYLCKCPIGISWETEDTL